MVGGRGRPVQRQGQRFNCTAVMHARGQCSMQAPQLFLSASGIVSSMSFLGKSMNFGLADSDTVRDCRLRLACTILYCDLL